MNRRVAISALFVFLSIIGRAEVLSDIADGTIATIDTITPGDTIVVIDTIAAIDTLQGTTEVPKKKKNFILRVIDSFSDFDERYIEPQHYLFTAMLQATYAYDSYTLTCKDNNVTQSVSFAPDGSIKLGPYFGWKWLFAGYTFTIGASSISKTKTEWDLSFYTSRFGIDLFYRHMGSDYKIRNVHLGNNIDTSPLRKAPFDGVSAGITGLNLYYIFNHRHFSYPAAFSQSTCQKISCGSWMAGVGYTKNSLSFDYDKLQALLDERLGPQAVPLDSGLKFKQASYFDISLSGGYAYNMVFAKHFLICISGQLALSYKESYGSTEGLFNEQRFAIRKFAPNLIGRFGIVYNNTRWYAGFSAIVRSNNYRDERYVTNNTFGSMNLYAGYNFVLRKEYRNKKK